MLDLFRTFVAENHLIPNGARVLVGYSGGPDSTCLLHLLHRAGIDCIAAHLHHGQREEADADLDHCRTFADSLGIPFVSGKADIPQLAKDRKIGIEEAGREARYAFFTEAAERTGCDLIATAHTKSDQAETVVLNAVRGAGLAGIAGIPLHRENIIRPLLFASRTNVEAYCRSEGLATLEDSTNKNTKFARPRVRALVMPELRKINSAVEDALARLAEAASEESAFLDSAAAAALERCEVPLNGDLRFLTISEEAALRRADLRHLPPVLLKRALRLVVRILGGKLDHATTQALAAELLLEENGSYTSQEGQVVVSWDRERVHAYSARDVPPFKEVLRVPGDTFSEATNWKLSVALVDWHGEPQQRSSLHAYMDIDAFRGPLHFRSVQDGDRMLPLGGVGKRKLSDLLGESKLTLAVRQRLPIICDIIGPIWAPGVAAEERVRVSPGSKKALSMVFAPFSSGPSESETLSGV